MEQCFTVVRDIYNYRYQKGSDNIVVTQFDSGIRLNFILLAKGELIDLSDCRVLITLKNEKDKIICSDDCVITKDLSLANPQTITSYTLKHGETDEEGTLTGMLDILDKEGNRTATSCFIITILPHL